MFFKILTLAISLTSLVFAQVNAEPQQTNQGNVVQSPRSPDTGEKIIPERMRFGSGHSGWKLTIPGNRPLATVAYEDGLIFVGGGYGSYEFYAIEATTGKVAWMFKAGDDGPTAAVVRKGYVVFNTESCIIYVLKSKTGEKVWEKWLGDPLMSQPAADDQYVYMAYPGNDGTHHLACMTLAHGKPVWDVKIAGDLISAPIIDKGSVYITCFDGTIYRYARETGKLVWSDSKQATSAPTIYEDKVFVSLRQTEKVGQDKVKQYEGLATLDNATGKQQQKDLWVRREAPYLVHGRSGAKTSAQAELDASVGFGSAPSTAKINQAKDNVGQASVAGCWAYQGSRPVVRNSRAYNAMGDEVQCVDAKTGRKIWSNKYDIKEEGIGGRFFAPPAWANNKLFFGSGNGEVYCIQERSGKLLWKEKVEGSVSFQPAIAKGMVFVACDNGNLYCINTGDVNDDGWYMWGGNSEHNK